MSGGVTIRDMEALATSLPDINVQHDLGNVIEINDFGGDDLGLLANSRMMNNNNGGGGGGGGGGGAYGGGYGGSGGGNGGYSQTNTVINVQPQGVGMSEVDITNIDPLEPIRMNIPDGGNGFSMPAINVMHSSNDNVFGNSQTASGPSINLTPVQPHRDVEAENKEKTDYINKLTRLEKRGFPVSRRYTLDNTLEEIKSEFYRLVDARNFETSVKFQKNMMMGFVTGMEWMNNKFDPFDLKLDGWSESVHENIDSYDDIFEDLYDKYKERGSMPPEARLLFAVAGSGFMFHISNSFFKNKMSGVSADDIFRQNPELARQFTAAAAQQAGAGFGKMMGSAMGMSPQPQPQYNDPNVADPGPGTGAFFGSPMANVPMSAATPSQPPVRRREMKGPSGVDDILKTFEEVRQAQESPTMFMPPNPNPSNRPATVAASEIQSQDDMGSVGTARTGAPRRGGGRRTKVPVEQTIMLNV